MDKNSWFEKHIQFELERINKAIEGIDTKLDETQISLAELKTEVKIKSKFWAAVGGAIGTISTVIIGLFVWFIRTQK